ncbi:MAG: HAMP domain-containing histidine kinase [Clostridia bacterium]|nr:HAMP domain-containing histidine kinase [Clostridia bacterium]
MKRNSTKISVFGVIAFFLLIAATVTVSMFIFHVVNKRSAGDRKTIASVMLLTIIFLSLVCTLCDLLRRRVMIDRPTEQILDATERIAAGDFSTRLLPRHRYAKYDQYDVIMENLNTMAAELQKSEVLKTDFISNVSHELKTPLTVIRSYAELLQTETDEETRKKYAETLVQAANRLSGLTSNILQLSKLENQKILPEKKKFRLDESLAECILGFEEVLEQKKIELSCELDEVEIFSSQSYLELVWNNLFSNAVKFTEKGGVIAITLKKGENNAVVSVSDSGCGISAEAGARLFDKFYQGDTSHAHEGNGLGLALVKKVIDILGGEIFVESEINKGSTFTVTIRDNVES